MSSNLVINASVSSATIPSISGSVGAQYASGQTISQSIVLKPSTQFASITGFSTLTITPNASVQLVAQKGSNTSYLDQVVNQLTIIDDTVDAFQIVNNSTTATVTLTLTYVVTIGTTIPVVGIVTSVNGSTGAVTVNAANLPGLSAVGKTGLYSSLLSIPTTFNPPVATASVLGGVKQGTNVTIAGDGTLSVAAPYVLPAASASVLGGVKQGANVSIAPDGTLTANAQPLVPATTTVLGGVKQGAGVSIAGDGTLSANVLTVSGRTGNVLLAVTDVSDGASASGLAASGGAALVGYGSTTVAAELAALSAVLVNARTVSVVAATSIGQTVFPVPGGYPVGLIDTFILGAHLTNGNDYAATDGLNIVVTSAVATRVIVGTNLVVEAFGSFAVANAIAASTLAASGGAALVGYGSSTVKQALDALATYQATLVGAIGRPLDSKLSDNLSLLDFADANYRTDSTAMFKLAIAAINAIVNAQGFSYPVPSIELPAGTYPLTDTLQVFPWHRFVTRGSVVLDFTNLPVGQNGIECRNEQTTIPLGDMLFATKGPFLNGIDGTLCLRGPGKTVSTGFAIVMGNRTTVSQPVRDTGGRNVIATGWYAPLHYDPVNLYLITWEGCRFEQNNLSSIHTSLPAGFTQVLNSGERMTFIDCTFAAAQHVLYHNCDGFDYQFVTCSMDYNDAPFFFDTAARYTNVKIIGGHIEAFDGPIMDGSVAGQYIEIMISNWDVLPTHRTVTTAIASPTRTLFVSNPSNRMRLSINGMVVYYLHPPYLPDSPMIDDNVFITGLNGIIFRSFYPMTTRSRSLGRDYAFAVNAVGTAGNALTYWVRDTGSTTFVDITSNTIVTDPSTSALGNTLHLLGGGTDAAATFHTVETFQCSPGDVLYPQADAYAPTVTAGTIGVRVFARYYDEAGVAVTPTSDFGTTYSMATAFTDTTLPNFSLGQNRWMAINGAVVVAPPFATTFRIYFTVTSFTGDLYIKNVRAIKG